MRTPLVPVVWLAQLSLPAAAQTVVDFAEDFDAYSTPTFSGTSGWVSNDPFDPWSTEFGGGVYASVDGSTGTWGSGGHTDDELIYTGRTWADSALDAVLTTDDDDAMGLVLRYQDPENFYVAFVTNDGAPNVGTGAPRLSVPGAHLYVVANGFATELATAPLTYTTLLPQKMRFVADGTTLSVWFDGDGDGNLALTELVLTTTDATFADGYLGLYCYDHGDVDGTACSFDDVSVNLSDADGDGHIELAGGGDDCNDHDPTVFQGAAETCDLADDDCDGVVDDGVQIAFHADVDHDTYGAPASTVWACAPGVGVVVDGTDCDDASSQDHPGANEFVNNNDDENCDGKEDCFQDQDDDNWGTSVHITSNDMDCGDAFESVRAGDCADTAPAIHPQVAEVCDGVDQDCDGTIDEGVSTTYYADADDDGYGDAATGAPFCAAPPDRVLDATDCDDALGSTHPGATEVCDGIDQDCDGTVDDGVTVTLYADSDGDGFGDPDTTLAGCGVAPGAVLDATDCDDALGTVFPGAVEVGDGIDQDCDGTADDGVDTDGDGLDDPTEIGVTFTDPTDVDTDDDLLSDGAEVDVHHTAPLIPDTDGGGAPDGTEVLAGTDPLDPSDDATLVDTDDDGLTDANEPGIGTDPYDADTDDDGLGDGSEVLGGTIPVDPDSDDDGLLDGIERGVDAAHPDSAGFVPDADPTTVTDPLDADSDDDTIADGDEDANGDGRHAVLLGVTGTVGIGETDPLVTDTDDDGLFDGEEVTQGWSPIDVDTDDGGVEDGDEVLRGTDPADPDDDDPPAVETGDTGAPATTGDTGDTTDTTDTIDTVAPPGDDDDDDAKAGDPAGHYSGGCDCDDSGAPVTAAPWLALAALTIRRRAGRRP